MEISPNVLLQFNFWFCCTSAAVIVLKLVNDTPSSYSSTMECCFTQELAYIVYAAEIVSSHQISLSIFSTICTLPFIPKEISLWLCFLHRGDFTVTRQWDLKYPGFNYWDEGGHTIHSAVQQVSAKDLPLGRTGIFQCLSRISSFVLFSAFIELLKYFEHVFFPSVNYLSYFNMPRLYRRKPQAVTVIYCCNSICNKKWWYSDFAKKRTKAGFAPLQLSINT